MKHATYILHVLVHHVFIDLRVYHIIIITDHLVQRIHQNYKSYRATCVVTNLDDKAKIYKTTHPELCQKINVS